MINFDKQEQRIHEAFSQISVNTEEFKGKMRVIQPTKIKHPIKFPKIAVATLILMVMSATAYAAMGGFDFIRSSFDSPFIDYAVEQLEPVYAEDQGIQLEVLAAEQIDDTILLYLTIQDVSGEHLFEPFHWDSSTHGAMMTTRVDEVDEYTTHGWSVAYQNPDGYDERFNFVGGSAWPDWEIYIDGERTLAPGGGMGTIIHFDEETQTFYLEKIFSGFSGIDIPNMDILTLASDRIRINYHYELIGNADPSDSEAFIFYDRIVRGDWTFSVNVSDIDHPVITWEGVTASLEEGDFHFDYIRLSPFGIRGTSTQCLSALFDNLDHWFQIEIEIEDGTNIIAGLGGGGNSFFWHASPLTSEEEMIDVEAVTAIIINGYRIEVPN